MTFLIDAQLPPNLAQWIQQTDAHKATHIGDHPDGLILSDTDIWTLAKDTNAVIVTKDLDFIALSTIYGSPPQVVLVRYGNCTNHTLRHYLSRAWEEILFRLEQVETRLIVLTQNYLEVYR